MNIRKEFKGYQNVGDINYMDYGGHFIKKEGENYYYSVSINPLEDSETVQYIIQSALIDITDSWIDKKSVMSFTGMSEDDYNNDKLFYAESVIDYYGYYHCNGSEVIESGIKKAYSTLLNFIGRR